MKNLNNSSVNTDETGTTMGFRPSVGARNPQVNELDKLIALRIPSVGKAGGLAWQ